MVINGTLPSKHDLFGLALCMQKIGLNHCISIIQVPFSSVIYFFNIRN